GVNHTLEQTRGPGGEYYITDAFQYMIDRGAKIRTAEVRGWYDCGQLETLIETNRHLLERDRARVPDGRTRVRIHPPVRIEEFVELEDADIWPNVTIGSGSVILRATLRDCIIGEHTTVVGSRLHDSLIGDNVRVEGVDGSVSLVDHSSVVG